MVGLLVGFGRICGDMCCFVWLCIFVFFSVVDMDGLVLSGGVIVFVVVFFWMLYLLFFWCG